MDEDKTTPIGDTEEQIATQSVVTDEGTGKTIKGEYLYLKDMMGDNHYFKDWNSVVAWAKTKVEEISNKLT